MTITVKQLREALAKFKDDAIVSVTETQHYMGVAVAAHMDFEHDSMHGDRPPALGWVRWLKCSRASPPETYVGAHVSSTAGQ